MTIEEFVSLLDGVKQTGSSQYIALCPAHEDRQESLSVGLDQKTGKILVHCFALCDTQRDVLPAMGLDIKDLFLTEKPTPEKFEKIRKKKKEPKPQINDEIVRTEKMATYTYANANGEPVHRVSRLHFYDKNGNRVKKGFPQEQFVDGNWIKGTDKIETVPYKLPEIIEAMKTNKPIWIVEGEKDVENMYLHGYTATCFNSGHDWKDHYKKYFQNSILYIIPDNDDPGREKAEKIARGLYKTATFIKIVNLPGLKEKQDVSDYFDMGGQYYDLFDYARDEKVYTISGNGVNVDEVREKIYKEQRRGSNVYYTLIDRRLASEIRKHFDVITAKNGNKVEYYYYREGAYEYIELEYFATLFEHWIKEDDATDYKLNQICKYYAKRKENYIERSILNARKDLVNLNNCVYDLKHHKPLPHNSKYFFTFKTDFNYDPEANCPIFDKALQKYSLGDTDWIKTFWEIAGYIQVGTYEHQKMFWFIGSSGGNGKGTVLRIMHNLVGDQFTFTVPITADLSDKFFRENLRGKRFAYTPDLEKRFKNLGLIKQITGGDKQMSDVKYGRAVTFDSTAKIVMAMNQLPDFGDGKNLSPLARRVIILNFLYTLKKEDIDPEIELKFKEEMPGIFNKSMEGLKRLQKRGHFTDSDKGKKELNKLLERSSLIDQWIYENLMFDISLSQYTHYYKLWESYVIYMKENYPNWQNDKFVIRTKKDMLDYLKDKFKNSKQALKSAWDSDWRDPIEKNLVPKTGSQMAFIGIKLMNDSEREKRLAKNGSASIEGSYLHDFHLIKEEEAF